MSVDNLNNQFSAIRSDSGSSTRVGARFNFLNSACGPTVDSTYVPVYQESLNYSTAPNELQIVLDNNTYVQRIVTNVPNPSKPYVYYATNNIGAGSN